MTSFAKNAFKLESRIWDFFFFLPRHFCCCFLGYKILLKCSFNIFSVLPVLQTPQHEEKRNLELGGHVGFDSLPDQLVSKSVAHGFCFNILCVGMSALKVTCINMELGALMHHLVFP